PGSYVARPIVRPPIVTSSNRPWVNWRTSSGASKRFRMTSSMEVEECLVRYRPGVIHPPTLLQCLARIRERHVCGRHLDGILIMQLSIDRRIRIHRPGSATQCGICSLSHESNLDPLASCVGADLPDSTRQLEDPVSGGFPPQIVPSRFQKVFGASQTDRKSVV